MKNSKFKLFALLETKIILKMKRVKWKILNLNYLPS